ncbi:TadE family protein [Kineococcus rubinsiae]|uniref:TadE family protein n=1 Tax=Kineococcus rubinsiae TaxID=2609562 RepID=UPI0014303126|nr:TadE family protein [Kineococcus rubinsiae]NIZ90811.1 pilus assembly protein [Kineococcus rubinsiae]
MSAPRDDRSGRRAAGDEGSAVAEFAGVAGLLSLLFVAVLQLGLVLHVRSTAVDCAGEGARAAALAGGSPAAGVERTRELLSASLSPRYAADVTARVVDVEGAPVVEVRVRAPLPLVALFGPARGLDVRGHALQETA